MEEIRDRLKQFRKTTGLNQSDFAQKLGIIQRTYSSYEGGDRAIPDRFIVSVCAVYGISETWLRTGEGEMYEQKTTDEEIAEFLGEVMASSDDDVRKRIISALARTSPEDWQAFARFLDRLTKKEGGE